MAMFKQLQGKAGEQRFTRVNGRFGGDRRRAAEWAACGGDIDVSDRAYDKLCRRAAMERDQRRVFARSEAEMVDEAVELVRQARRGFIDASTGAFVRNGGGLVFFDDCSRPGRRARIVFGKNGRAVAAHF